MKSQHGDAKNGFILLVIILLFAGVLSTPQSSVPLVECNDGLDNNLNGLIDGFPDMGQVTFRECHRNTGTTNFANFVYCPLWTSESVGIDANPQPPDYSVFGC